MSDAQAAFEQAGYGAREVGFGRRPAVLVVDFQRAFTEPKLSVGGGPHVQAAVERAAEVLAALRARGVPVVHTAVAYRTAAELGRWKVPVLAEITPGSSFAETDPRVWEDTDEYVVKRAPSAFFGTDVAGLLRVRDVDTVIVMGCTTSGCVRASIVDAFSHGFRTVVADDCCGDQSEQTHRANLDDVGRRYADVMSGAAVLAALG